jgi:hypothetical protein
VTETRLARVVVSLFLEEFIPSFHEIRPLLDNHLLHHIQFMRRKPFVLSQSNLRRQPEFSPSFDLDVHEYEAARRDRLRKTQNDTVRTEIQSAFLGSPQPAIAETLRRMPDNLFLQHPL